MIFQKFNNLYKKNEKNGKNTFINHQILTYFEISWEE